MKKISFIISVIIMSFGAVYLAIAWTEPVENPPAGNVATPINESLVAQAKQGALVVGANSAVTTGLIVQYGNVGIGTTDPEAKLEVSGQIKITGGSPGTGKVLTSDSAGLASWSSFSGIPSGMIAMFDTSCPAGWTRFSALDNKFPMGSSGYGSSGGASTHTHGYKDDIFAWSSSVYAQIPSYNAGRSIGSGYRLFYNTYSNDNGVMPNYSTGVSVHEQSKTTDASSSLPPYLSVVWCKKN